jgi:hypothetical protein
VEVIFGNKKDSKNVNTSDRDRCSPNSEISLAGNGVFKSNVSGLLDNNSPTQNFSSTQFGNPEAVEAG